MAPFHFEPMSKWLDPVFEEALKGSVVLKPNAEHLVWPLASCGIGAFVVGSGLAYWMYIVRAGEPAKAAAEAMPGLYRCSSTSGAFDELYEFTVLAMVDALADTFAAFDVIGGRRHPRAAHVARRRRPRDAPPRVPERRGPRLQRLHGHRPRGDGLVLRRPARRRHRHRRQRRRLHGPGGQGMGYTYRWDANGDGSPTRSNSAISSRSRSTSTPARRRRSASR